MRGIFDKVSTSVPRVWRGSGLNVPGAKNKKFQRRMTRRCGQRNCGGGCLLRTGANVPSHARIASTSSWVIVVMLG